jgi:hypothetical protein
MGHTSSIYASPSVEGQIRVDKDARRARLQPEQRLPDI